ncbi:hypothetical protein E2562_037626 [Oryza meyeriana var. granulata]|uniref:KIB1-4 beta-propeller domain-containing protein n=1 Tax=Oryza meyeriana var. granulata TaxID=110450 RepID=A0A6G1CBB7_9ORYZ|nr:hypothetical protein E2562_037626 [Oryza meyeriana var. granulata]
MRRDLADASIHRVPFPDGVDVDGKTVCRGSFGNWIALVPPRRPWRPRGKVRPLLLNPFSGARVRLPILTSAAAGGGDEINVEKVIMSWAPDSDVCVVVAIVTGSYGSTREIAIWRPRQESWSTPASAPALRPTLKTPSSTTAISTPSMSAASCTSSQIPTHGFSGDGDGHELHPLRFEMDLMRTDRYVTPRSAGVRGKATHGDQNWSPVTRLDRQVLFLGAGCCRGLPVTERDKVRGGPICFLDDKAEITAVVTIDVQERLDRSVLIRRSMDVPASHVLDTFRRRGGCGPSPASTAGRRNQCPGFGGLQDLIG